MYLETRWGILWLECWIRIEEVLFQISTLSWSLLGEAFSGILSGFPTSQNCCEEERTVHTGRKSKINNAENS